jgi:hypothetical protein
MNGIMDIVYGKMFKVFPRCDESSGKCELAK